MTEAYDKLKQDTELLVARLAKAEQRANQLGLDKLALEKQIQDLQGATGTSDADLQVLDAEVLVALGDPATALT